MIKPDARIVPTQEELEAWEQHPVTKFVAEAYRVAAEKQCEEWARFFEINLVPADLASQRLVLRTREDAYRSILENTLADYIAIVEGAPPGRKIRAPQAGQRRA